MEPATPDPSQHRPGVLTARLAGFARDAYETSEDEAWSADRDASAPTASASAMEVEVEQWEEEEQPLGIPNPYMVANKCSS